MDKQFRFGTPKSFGGFVLLEIFNERVQIKQSSVLALLQDFLRNTPHPTWYIEEANSADCLEQNNGVIWVQFLAWDEVTAHKEAIKRGRLIVESKEGVTATKEEVESYLSNLANRGKDHDAEKVFSIVGTRMQYVEENGARTLKETDNSVNVATVYTLPINDIACRIRIALAEIAPPLPEFFGRLAYHILKETEGEERAESWRKKNTQGAPTELTARALITAQMQAQTDGASSRGMSDERRKRADTFKKIKDANTRLSYAQVAIKAWEQGYRDATEDDVRNDYRAMQWEWKRANEVR